QNAAYFTINAVSVCQYQTARTNRTLGDRQEMVEQVVPPVNPLLTASAYLRLETPTLRFAESSATMQFKGKETMQQLVRQFCVCVPFLRLPQGNGEDALDRS